MFPSIPSGLYSLKGAPQPDRRIGIAIAKQASGKLPEATQFALCRRKPELNELLKARQ